MKRIVIEFKYGKVETNIEGISQFSDLLVALAALEGVFGGIMQADKSELRTAVDEIQKDLQAQLPEGAE